MKEIYLYLKSIFTQEQITFEEWTLLVEQNLSGNKNVRVPFIAEYWSKRLMNEIIKKKK